VGPWLAYRGTGWGTETDDITPGSLAVMASTDPIPPVDQYSNVGLGHTDGYIFPRLYYSGAGKTWDGTRLYSKPRDVWTNGYQWWNWSHCHFDANGVERHICSMPGSSDDMGDVYSGIYNSFYSTTYGETSYYNTSNHFCLDTRVSGWNTGNRAAGVWAISTTVAYLFFIRSGQVYFVKRDDNADTWSAQTQVTTGAGTITKLLIRPVGAGQSTKLYLITDNGGKVYIWDWSTESSVASSFTIPAFPTHMPKDAPINIGSDYYHFHYVYETRVAYRWKYTSATYANPTLTTYSAPSAPGFSDEYFLGFSFEFNNSTNELYTVAFWRNRVGWYPTGDWFFRMKYAESTAASPSWSAATMVGKRPVYSDGTDPWKNGAYGIPGTTPDGLPWKQYGMGGPYNVAVLSAYSHGSNHPLRRTMVCTTLETAYYSNPEEEGVLRGDIFYVNFWEDGVAFYVDGEVHVDDWYREVWNEQWQQYEVENYGTTPAKITIEGVVGSDGDCHIVPNLTVTLNESYVSSYAWSSTYDIEGANAFQNGEVSLQATWTVTPNGSLESELFVSGEVSIDAQAVLTLDGDTSAVVETEMFLHVPYFVLGTSYHEEFLTYINAKRAEYGLPPYLIPTEAMYATWTDIAQLHAENMASTRTFAHENGNLPAAWNTYLERYAVAGAEGMTENILAHFPDGQLNNPIWDDATAPSPYEAYDLWWNSPTHRENILYDWNSTSIYSWFGIGLGQADLAFGGYDDVIFYLCNNFGRYGPETTVMAQKDRALHLSYDFSGALVENLSISYDLETYTPVTAIHEDIWGIKIAQNHSNLYGAMVAVAHEAPIFYGLTVSHTASYTGTVSVKGDHTEPYRLSAYEPVVKGHTSLYAVRVSVAGAALYESKPEVRSEHIAPYTDPVRARAENINLYSVPGTVNASHVGVYGVPTSVKGSNVAGWSLQLTARSSHQSPYLLLTGIKKDHEAEFDIRTVNTVRANSRDFYSLLSEGTVIESSPSTVTLPSSTAFSIPELVLETSEDSSVWSATFKVYRREEFLALNEGDQIIISVGGDAYTMVVLTKSLNRSNPANVDMRVTAASPLVLLDSPRASQSSYSFDTPMMAKDMVESILGETVTWSLVNWQIPANRVQFQDVVPLEAAKRVVQAAGGVIQSNNDGTILVRSEFPVATNSYADATPDHVYTDDSDNISMSEGYEYTEQFNQFRISELEQSQGDSFEWVPSEESVLVGTLRFYPSPWRDTVTVRTTEDVPTAVYNLLGGVIREEVEDVVEFRNGVASVQYPIFGVPTVEWLSESLGGVVTTDFSSSLTAPKFVNGGYGLARVTYQVKAIEFAVQGVDGTSVQFVAEEV
jgi:uncharacterized protein YkwD